MATIAVFMKEVSFYSNKIRACIIYDTCPFILLSIFLITSNQLVGSPGLARTFRQNFLETQCHF